MESIFMPTVRAMSAEGRKFSGVIYFGLMLTPDGPKVIEYNARFGDPETQAVLSLLESDLLDIFLAVSAGSLSGLDIKWSSDAACCVVLASGGYPGAYETGFGISGLSDVPDSAFVYHSGTARAPGGGFVTNGGRVLGVTATGTALDGAIRSAYDAAGNIGFKGLHMRRDIGRL